MNISLTLIIPLLISELILSILILISFREKKLKKIRMHNNTIFYETNFDKNINILKLQKRLIFKLKIKSYLYELLYKMRGILK